MSTPENVYALLGIRKSKMAEFFKIGEFSCIADPRTKRARLVQGSDSNTWLAKVPHRCADRLPGADLMCRRRCRRWREPGSLSASRHWCNSSSLRQRHGKSAEGKRETSEDILSPIREGRERFAHLLRPRFQEEMRFALQRVSEPNGKACSGSPSSPVA